MKRVGLLTSGGDCQSLNAVLRAIALGLYSFYGEENVELVGFREGYRGLVEGDYVLLTPADLDASLLTRGGTILGTSRLPFKRIRERDEKGRDKVEAMKETYCSLELEGVFILGGNGSMKTANLLREEGLSVIGLAKTIDNDLWGTQESFGFGSAVDVAARAMDRLRTTAQAHKRCFLVELMGHKAGWLTLYAGMAAGADVILIPEIPYRPEKVVEAVRARQGCALVAVAEGAVTAAEAALPPLQRKREQKKRGSAAQQLAQRITAELGTQCRTAVPGHLQRGGAPAPMDRVLASRMGAYAAGLFHLGQFGTMAALRGGEIAAVPLAEAALRLKTVPPHCDLVTEARLLGISFGD